MKCPQNFALNNNNNQLNYVIKNVSNEFSWETNYKRTEINTHQNNKYQKCFQLWKLVWYSVASRFDYKEVENKSPHSTTQRTLSCVSRFAMKITVRLFSANFCIDFFSLKFLMETWVLLTNSILIIVKCFSVSDLIWDSFDLFH